MTEKYLSTHNSVTQWTSKHEDVLVDWSDRAMCYRWMHSKSAQEYSFLSNSFTIPVIIMSTLTGTANFAIDRFPLEYQPRVQMAIGTINLFAGMITTVQQFLKINELSESHRVASLSWDKFYRNVRMELTKNPLERTNVMMMMKTSKEEFDRLMEICPPISRKMACKFRKKFKDDISWQTISKPDICDILEPARSIVYSVDEDFELKNEESRAISKIIKEKGHQIEIDSSIESFMVKFHDEYLRTPTTTEVIENLRDTIDVKIIENWLSKQTKNKKAPPILIERGDSCRFTGTR